MFVNRKDFTEATALLDIAIEIDEDLPIVWALKGHVLYETRDVSNAYKHYIHHLQLIPGTQQSFQTIDENKDKSSVMSQIDVSAIYRLGRIEKQSENYDQAYSTFVEAIEFGCDNRWIFWYESGQCAFEIQQYENAITCLKRAIEMNKENIHCWCLLALAYCQTVESDMTIRFLLKYTRV